MAIVLPLLAVANKTPEQVAATRTLVFLVVGLVAMATGAYHIKTRRQRAGGLYAMMTGIWEIRGPKAVRNGWIEVFLGVFFIIVGFVCKFPDPPSGDAGGFANSPRDNYLPPRPVGPAATAPTPSSPASGASSLAYSNVRLQQSTVDSPSSRATMKQPPLKPPTNQFAGTKSRHAFEAVTPQEAMLVGMQVGRAKYGGYPAIRWIQPLFQIDGAYAPGAHYGTGLEEKTLAKKGYAVGGIRAEGYAMLTSLQFVYMKISGDHLDPRDSYDSQWLGAQSPDDHQDMIGGGQPVVGIYGFKATTINGFGLIVDSRRGPPLRRPRGPGTTRSDPTEPFVRSELVGLATGSPFDDSAPEAAYLVGANVVSDLVSLGGKPVIESIEPLYSVDGKVVKGKQYGPNYGAAYSFAKKGYAVGAMLVKVGTKIMAIQLVYMRIVGNRLDPNDSYESEILGDAEISDAQRLDGQGALVTGIYGSYDGVMDGIGLKFAAD